MLNDIKGPEAPSLDAWTTAAALAAITYRLEPTPCQKVYRERALCSIPAVASARYPHNLIFKNMRV